jgi:hypothetical protein
VDECRDDCDKVFAFLDVFPLETPIPKEYSSNRSPCSLRVKTTDKYCSGLNLIRKQIVSN